MLKHPLMKLSGLLAALLFIFMIILIGYLTPNYSHLSQYVSELGADQAPYAWWMNYLGIMPFGLGLLLFSVVIVSLPAKQEKIKITASLFLFLSAIGFVLAGAFPCDVGCSFENMSTSAVVHNLSAFAAFLLAIIGVGLFSLLKYELQRPLVSVLAALAMIMFLGLMMYLGVESSYIGLAQRCFLLTLCIWMVVTSKRIYGAPS